MKCDAITATRATVKQARLTMRINLPEAIMAAMREDDKAIAAGIAVMPEWARPVVGAYRAGSPHAKTAEEALDWESIRAEFSRKAKKLELNASSDVSFDLRGDGFDLWCFAH
jgi:hypothetical protein